jgi:PAS domain-containing protein
MESMSTNESVRFRHVGNELLELLEAEGVTSKLRLARDESLPYLNALPEDAQKAVLIRLEMMLSLCKQTMANGASISSPSAVLETFFQNIGLSSIEGLFENVQEEDAIEFWDTNHQLVFANLRIFAIVGYPLEEIFCRPWTDLLARELPEIDAKLLSLGNEMLTGKKTKLTSTAVIPDHVCYEKDSPLRQSYKLMPNFFAPVIAGYICCNRIEVIEK